MTNTELQTELLSRIPHLDREQLKEVYDLVENLSTQKKEAEKTELKEREFGSMKGFVKYMAEDFDAPLDEFKDYMPE